MVAEAGNRPEVPMTGEECALIMVGAVTDATGVLGRFWLREYGDLFRGRNGSMMVVPEGEGGVSAFDSVKGEEVSEGSKPSATSSAWKWPS